LAGITKSVFSNYKYAGLAVVVFVSMFVLLSALSEYVFFQPYFVFYVPDDRLLGFVLIIGISALSAIVIPLNVYRAKILQKSSKVGSFSGSFIGVSAGACSCGPVGYAIISTFGTAGSVATAFLTSYEIPLRIISIAVLGCVYYATVRSLAVKCKIR
jgi:uncharacterized membrane protein YraQ (UPF0718 family)